MARRDVSRGADDHFHFAGVIEHRLKNVIVHTGNAAFTRKGNFTAKGLPGPHDVLNFFHVHLGVPGRITQFVEALSYHLIESLGVDLQQTTIGIKKPSLRIEDIGEIIRR